MDKDAKLLFNHPLHTFAQYTAAHAMAGTLELVKEEDQRVKEEQEALARMAPRSGRAGERYRK
jgi:hypothetical protein